MSTLQGKPPGGADSNRPSLQWWGSPNICRNPCQCLYLWAEPLICRARVGLVVSDIPPVEASEDVRGISQRIEEAWALETSGRGKSGCAGLCWLTACCFRGKDGSGVSFLRALVRSFGFKGWAFCLALIGASTFRITSTIMMGFLIRWFSAGGPWYEAVLCSLGMSGAILGVTYCHHAYYFYCWRKGLNARTGVVAFLYSRVLQMRLSTLGQTTTGQVITISSTDTERLQFFMMFAYYLFHSMFESAAIIACIGWQLGWTACVALCGCVAILLPIQYHFSLLFGKLRMRTSKCTDERVRIMSEIVGGASVLKMYAWEEVARQRIDEVREREVGHIRWAAVVRGINEGLYFASFVIISFVALATASILGGVVLNSEKVFTTLSFCLMMRLTLFKFWVFSVQFVAEARIACRRIGNLLLLVTDETIARTAAIAGAASAAESVQYPEEVEIAEAEAKAKKCADRADDGTDDGGTDVIFALHDASFSWTADAASDTAADGSSAARAAVLRGVTLSATRGELVCVVGPVGSGKTSLLMAIAGEIDAIGGAVDVPSSRRCYVGQQQWVLSASIKENITIGQRFDEAIYAEVLHACCLEDDLQQLAHGDATLVGERGATLSGGQRARVALARACYTAVMPREDGAPQKSALVLLDDPLSAVDTVVGRALFDGCIGHGLSSGNTTEGALLRKHNCTRILVTHQLQYVAAADQIVVIGTDGTMVAQGSPAALLQSTDSAVVAVLKEIGELSREKAETTETKVPEPQLESVTAEPAPAAVEEPAPAAAGGEGEASGEDGDEGDIVRDASPVASAVAHDGEDGAVIGAAAAVKGDATTEEEKKKMTVDLDSWTESKVDGKVRCSTWLDYGSAFGCGSALGGAPGGTPLDHVEKARSPTLKLLSKLNGILSFAVLVAFIVTAPVLLLGSSYWFAAWAETSVTEQRSTAGRLKWPGVGALLSIALTVWGILRAVIFFVASVNASKKLHASMFAGVVRAPNMFFERNPSGRILNRFSSDLATVDEMLPPAFFDFLAIGATCAASIAVGFMFQPLVLMIAIPLCGAFIGLRRLYIQAAREVKRFDSLSRSPIYSQLAESLAGLATLRTFGLQAEMMESFATKCNTHASIYFAFISTSRWLGMRLDLLNTFFTGTLALVAVLIRVLADSYGGGAGSGTELPANLVWLKWFAAAAFDPALIGLSLTFLIQMGDAFQWMVRQSCEVENALVGVERITEYARLRPEAALYTAADESLEEGWPAAALSKKQGEEKQPRPRRAMLQLSCLSATYDPKLPPALDHLSVALPRGCTVGVVGRTGAGKSTLLKTIFRLIEPTGGGGESESSSEANRDVALMLGGVDAQTLGLHTLRQCLGVIPQQPWLFSGSLRYNIDPFSKFSIEECVEAIREAQLLPSLTVSSSATTKSSSSSSTGSTNVNDDASPGTSSSYNSSVRDLLDFELTENGANLSSGQQQLVCLARALLRRSRMSVLIADEATAMVDNESDELIQHALRTAFKDVLVITIAHRLKTIIDCDVVLVLARGRLVEAGPPHILLSSSGGGGGDAAEKLNAKARNAGLPLLASEERLFMAMVDECGSKVAAELRVAAEAAFAARVGKEVSAMTEAER